MQRNKMFGIYMLVSGFWGLIILFNEAFVNKLNLNQILIVLIFIVLYAVICYSGYLLLKSHWLAYKLAFAALLMQLVQVFVGDFGFAFVGGPYIGLNIGENIDFFFQPLYAFFYLSLEQQEVEYLSINIVPLLIFISFRKEFTVMFKVR